MAVGNARRIAPAKRQRNLQTATKTKNGNPDRRHGRVTPGTPDCCPRGPTRASATAPPATTDGRRPGTNPVPPRFAPCLLPAALRLLDLEDRLDLDRRVRRQPLHPDRRP